MELVFLIATVTSVFVSFVDGAGYLQIRPPSLKQCCYTDINKAHFSYDRDFCEGPKNWCKVHPCWTTCGSKRRQSPININTNETIYRRYPRLKFENILKRVIATIRNNGHAPYFEVHEMFEDEITLCNVPERPRKKEYNFAQLHVHLGRDEKKDLNILLITNSNRWKFVCHQVFTLNVFAHSWFSNVLIGAFLMEVNPDKHFKHAKFIEAQMVFYDKDYEDVAEAKSKRNGLVVISVMIEVYGRSKENDDCGCDGETCTVRYARKLSTLMEKYYEKVRLYPLTSINPDFWTLLRLPRKCLYNNCGRTPSKDFIEKRCEKEEPENRPFFVFEGITPLDVMPYDTNRFYTYAGSLTSPPCYETVQWVVYKCPIKVSTKAFKMLQLVQDSHLNPLAKFGVRRPLQTNTNVIVYRNHLK